MWMILFVSPPGRLLLIPKKWCVKRGEKRRTDLVVARSTFINSIYTVFIIFIFSGRQGEGEKLSRWKFGPRERLVPSLSVLLVLVPAFSAVV